MMLGVAAFGVLACTSSVDICASDDLAKRGPTPAPSASRLKSRRFIGPLRFLEPPELSTERSRHEFVRISATRWSCPLDRATLESRPARRALQGLLLSRSATAPPARRRRK